MDGTLAPWLIAGIAGFGRGAEDAWVTMRDNSWEGILQKYENNEISEEDMQFYASIRFASDEDWEVVVNAHKDKEITDEEFEYMKWIREMPEEWTTGGNALNGGGAGIANAVWEGGQWYVGAKVLPKWTPFKSGFANSAARVGVDTVFNAADTPYRSIVDVNTTDKSWVEAWEANGGWTSVLMNTGIGLGGSVVGEVFDNVHLRKVNGSAVTPEIPSIALIDVDKMIKNSGIEGLSDTNVKYYKDKMIADHNARKIDMTTMTDIDVKNYIYNDIKNSGGANYRDQDIIRLYNPDNIDKSVENIANFLDDNYNVRYDPKEANAQKLKVKKYLKGIMSEEEANALTERIFERIDQYRDNNRVRLRDSDRLIGAKDRIYPYFSQHPELGITPQKLDESFNKVILCKTDEEFDNIAISKGCSKEDYKNWLGVHYGDDGTIAIRPGQGVDTIIHEVNHDLGNVYMVQGGAVKHGTDSRGIDEAFTEKLALGIAEMDGNGNSGYAVNVGYLNEIVNILEKAGYQSIVALSYYTNNSAYFAVTLNQIMEDDSFYDELIKNMDIADGYSTNKPKITPGQARIEIQGLITRLETKLGV